jgi:hypothetical protein
MSKPNLTAEEVRSLFHYDPDTGVFTRKVNRHRFKSGEVAGTKSDEGYINIKVQKSTYKAHRLAWLYVYGAFPDLQIDHINGIRSDNRIANLREVTHSGNTQNQRTYQRSNKSGFLGVSPNNRRWKATISVHGEYKYLGTFDTPELAHQAYLDAKRSLHLTCTI